MPRVLVLPGDVRYNFGDTAICLVILGLVRKVAPGSRIAVWGARPCLPGGFEEIRFIERFVPALAK